MLNENDVGPPSIGMRIGSTKIWFTMEMSDKGFEDIQMEMAVTMDAPIIVQVTGTMRGLEEEEEEEEEGALERGVEGGERTAAFLRPRDDDVQHIRKVGILYICSIMDSHRARKMRYPAAAHLPPHNNNQPWFNATSGTFPANTSRPKGLLRRSFCLSELNSPSIRLIRLIRFQCLFRRTLHSRKNRTLP